MQLRDFLTDQVNPSERVVPNPRAGCLHTALSNMLADTLPLTSIFCFFTTGSNKNPFQSPTPQSASVMELPCGEDAMLPLSFPLPWPMWVHSVPGLAFCPSGCSEGKRMAAGSSPVGFFQKQTTPSPLFKPLFFIRWGTGVTQMLTRSLCLSDKINTAWTLQWLIPEAFTAQCVPDTHITKWCRSVLPCSSFNTKKPLYYLTLSLYLQVRF